MSHAVGESMRPVWSSPQRLPLLRSPTGARSPPVAAAMPNALQQIPAHDGSRAGEERALRRWLQSLKRLPRLTIEEEQRLVARAQEDPAVSADAHRAARVPHGADRAGLPLRALRALRHGQDGIEGLMTALERYEPERQLRFSTYALVGPCSHQRRGVDAPRRHALRDQPRAQEGPPQPLPNRARAAHAGLVPSAALVARALDVSEDDVTAARTFLAVAAISAESPVGPEGSASWRAARNDGPSVEAVVEARLTAERRSAAFEEFAATLNTRERMLWDERMQAEDPRHARHRRRARRAGSGSRKWRALCGRSCAASWSRQGRLIC